MIDFHAHVLPGIDDGSRSMEESVEIVKNAYQCGVTDLIVTPHFILGSIYNSNNQKKKKLLEELKKKVKDIPIHLYLGNEVFVEPNMLDLLKKGEITTLNQSRYLLFELPRGNKYKEVKEIVFQLKVNGCIPVIAHPERYVHFRKHPEIVEELIDQGVLFQCNIGSFYGMYGKEAKKFFLLMLKHHMIHFICSDVHRSTDPFYPKVKNFQKDLTKYLSKEEVNELLEENARHIIKDELFQIREMIPFHKTVFGKWK